MLKYAALFALVSLLTACGSGGLSINHDIGIPASSPDVATLAVGTPRNISVSCYGVTGCWVNWFGHETWDDAIIYRSTTNDASTATQIGRTWAVGFFVDNTATPGVRYYYWVLFVDAQGNYSPLSRSVSGEVPQSPFANNQRIPAYEEEPIPVLKTIPGALQSPVVEDTWSTFVGGRGEYETLPNLEFIFDYNGMYMGTATTRDGVDRPTLAAFLRDAARYENTLTGTPVVTRRVEPGIVTFGGSDIRDRDVDLLTLAVQIVNTALPLEWRLQMSDDDPIPESGIHVEFLSRLNYQSMPSYKPGDRGVASTWTWDDGAISHTDITINREYMSDGTAVAVEVLAHELLHALGLGHVSDRWASLMRVHGNWNDVVAPFMRLHPIDRAALRAIYGRMSQGDAYHDFGEWDDLWYHTIGHSEYVEFGVSWGNGYGEPWAFGDTPTVPIARNPYLRGLVSWDGLLTGITPRARQVYGRANVNVNLRDLSGSADFTRMEEWQSNRWVMWGDGDLEYDIAVSGNTFTQTGGDEGYLTGSFFGSYHEGVGGTLERDDLTAAFGGHR